MQVTSGETGAGWLAFFLDLVDRGLSGLALVTSDAHAGQVDAVAAAADALFRSPGYADGGSAGRLLSVAGGADVGIVVARQTLWQDS